MHPTSVKNSIICCFAWNLYFWV